MFIFGSSKNSVYIFHLTVSQKNNLLQLPNKKLPNLAVLIPHSFPSECLFYIVIRFPVWSPVAVNFSAVTDLSLKNVKHNGKGRRAQSELVPGLPCTSLSGSLPQLNIHVSHHSPHCWGSSVLQHWSEVHREKQHPSLCLLFSSCFPNNNKAQEL